MRKVQRSDVLDFQTYNDRREAYRLRVMEEKAKRRIHVGEHLTFLFESTDTILYQVQEMTRLEQIVRDKDILKELSSRTDCTVCISVPCIDEDVWAQLEPGTAPPLKRLRAVRELVDAGIHAGVLMNPIVPGISSKPSLIEATVKAIADHGAKFVGCNVMFLEDGTRAHFMKFLEREFPSWLPRYEKLYEKKYAPEEYRKQVQGMIRVLQNRYGVSRREREPHEEKPTEPEQVGFAW